jgi:hypothetical protein
MRWLIGTGRRKAVNSYNILVWRQTMTGDEGGLDTKQVHRQVEIWGRRQPADKKVLQTKEASRAQEAQMLHASVFTYSC